MGEVDIPSDYSCIPIHVSAPTLEYQCTVCHQEFWNKVNIPVTSSAQALWRVFFMLEVFIQLQRNI